MIKVKILFNSEEYFVLGDEFRTERTKNILKLPKMQRTKGFIKERTFLGTGFRVLSEHFVPEPSSYGVWTSLETELKQHYPEHRL